MGLKVLHITSGDVAGAALAESDLPGEILVWHDVLYDGPRASGWPTDDILKKRAVFLAEMTGGGLNLDEIRTTLDEQYGRLGRIAGYETISGDERIVLWFDGCLFDQSMLVHILACLAHLQKTHVELLCIDSFPGIKPYNGLGQLSPDQLFAQYESRQPVTDEQFAFALRVEQAFADQDLKAMAELSRAGDVPIPWIPAAVRRWLEELPDRQTGLGKLERLALEAVGAGCEKPWQIFKQVAAADTSPQYWGDITLWQKINGLADREPPLVSIDGPAPRLPQWKSELLLNDFRISLAG